MSIFKQAQVLRFGSIVNADLARFDFELGLSQPPPLDQFRIWIIVLLASFAPRLREWMSRRHTARAGFYAEGRVPLLRQRSIGRARDLLGWPVGCRGGGRGCCTAADVLTSDFSWAVDRGWLTGSALIVASELPCHRGRDSYLFSGSCDCTRPTSLGALIKWSAEIGGRGAG